MANIYKEFKMIETFAPNDYLTVEPVVTGSVSGDNSNKEDSEEEVSD